MCLSAAPCSISCSLFSFFSHINVLHKYKHLRNIRTSVSHCVFFIYTVSHGGSFRSPQLGCDFYFQIVLKAEDLQSFGSHRVFLPSVPGLVVDNYNKTPFRLNCSRYSVTVSCTVVFFIDYPFHLFCMPERAKIKISLCSFFYPCKRCFTPSSLRAKIGIDGQDRARLSHIL